MHAYQYDEDGEPLTSAKDKADSGLKGVTYRPPAPPTHQKSTTCLGGCSRRGSSVSVFIFFCNFLLKKK